MSLGDVTVSSIARRRIRSFSVWAWITGAAIMAGVAFNTFNDVGIGGNGLGLLSEAGNPWEQANPTEFDDPDGDVWSGTGSGVIRIPRDEHNQEPYTVTLLEGENVDIFVTRPEEMDSPADERWPDNIAYLYEPDDAALVLPADVDLEIWVRADGDWEFTLATTEVDEITDGIASGKGNGFLVYRGDALSAHLIHKGEGIFFVTLQIVGGDPDQPVIETGNVEQRVSWDPTEAVYFSIESDDERGAWTVDIDELATDAPEPESPEPTPASPEPTPAAQPAAPASRPRRTRGTPSA